MVFSLRHATTRPSVRTPSPPTAGMIPSLTKGPRHHSPGLPRPSQLLNELLDLLLTAEKITDQYARLRHLQATTPTQENAVTAEALTWIQTSLEDITATLGAISREPPPSSGTPAQECLQVHPASPMLAWR